jgi:hypothetical protein
MFQGVWTNRLCLNILPLYRITDRDYFCGGYPTTNTIKIYITATYLNNVSSDREFVETGRGVVC